MAAAKTAVGCGDCFVSVESDSAQPESKQCIIIDVSPNPLVTLGIYKHGKKKPPGDTALDVCLDQDVEQKEQLESLVEGVTQTSSI